MILDASSVSAVIQGLFSTVTAAITAAVTLIVATFGGLWALATYYHSYKVKSREPFLKWQFEELQIFIDACAGILVANEASLSESINKFRSAKGGKLKVIGSEKIIGLADELDRELTSDYQQHPGKLNLYKGKIAEIADEAKRIIQKNWGIDDGFME